MNHFNSSTSANLSPQEKVSSLSLLSNNVTGPSLASSSPVNSHCYYSEYNSIVVSPPLTPAISPTSSLFLDNHASSSNDNSNNHAYNNTSMNSPISNYGGGGGTIINAVNNMPIHQQHKHVCHYDFCGWSFKRYEHLKRHILVHTGARPHVCHYPGCGKSFSRSDNFHAHYRTHTKTRKKKKGNNVVQQKSKSAAATTVPSSAVVTGGGTGTKNDSSQFPFLANQQHDQQVTLTTSANNCVAAASATAATNIATTAAVVAVSQQSSQPYNINQQVFYNTPQPFYHNTTSNIVSSIPSSFDQQIYHTIPSPPPPISNYTRKSSLALLNHESSTPFPFFLQASLSSNHGFYASNNPLTSPFMSINPPTCPSTSSPASYSMHNSPVTASPISSFTASSSYSNMSTQEAVSKKRSPKRAASLTKSHACPVPQCLRKFKRLEHLKRHARIHTFERPFHCSYPGCQKNFSRSDNLSQHIKIHTKELEREDKRKKGQLEGNSV